ncbi:MAG: hypothetical protein IT204_21650 [Fimbriimonadaceae bacterium]|nr:hypothetical protein [Fimbriimonadaceae bacterium]
MTGKERLETALAHREADRVPLDLGAMPFSGIVTVAYRNYSRYSGLELPEPAVADVKQQLAACDQRLLETLGVDTRPVRRGRSAKQTDAITRDGAYECFVDEWQLGWRRPVPDGLYFDLFQHPLADLSLEAVKRFAWPDPAAPERFEGMEAEVATLAAGGHALVMGGFCAGVWEMSLWLRGYDGFYLDMAAEPELADWLIGKMVDLKLAYWEQALGRVGQYVSACYEADDLGAQDALMVSPPMWRKLVKPHQARLFAGIKALAPHVKLVYHSDGAIFDVIGELIDLGIDALNPIQVSASGMGDTARLKATYGRDLCFWGGACDSQHTLPHGTPAAVREETKRRIGDLAPGGGYVFAGIHNIQADVPPANLEALWETFAAEAGY